MNLRRTTAIAALLALAWCGRAAAKLEPQPVSVEEATEVEIAHEAERIEDAMMAQGEARVIGRFASDLGVVPDSLVMEKVVLDLPWVDVLVAHVIHASARGTAVRDLLAMRRAGRKWAEIAITLGFAPSRVVRAIRAETRVAIGIARIDGHAARIRREREPRPAPEAAPRAQRGD